MWPITDWLWQSNRETVREAAADGKLKAFDRVYAVTEVALGLPDEYHWAISDDGALKDFRELADLIRDALRVLKVRSPNLFPATHSFSAATEKSRLLVYCEAGIRRSSMVCLALLCALGEAEVPDLSDIIEEAQKAIVKANPVAAFPPSYVSTVLEAIRSIDST